MTALYPFNNVSGMISPLKDKQCVVVKVNFIGGWLKSSGRLVYFTAIE